MRDMTDSGFQFLRAATALFERCNMTFVGKRTPEELLNIARASKACKWDVYPDQWSEWQLQRAAEHGDAPDFEVDDAGNLVPVEPE